MDEEETPALPEVSQQPLTVEQLLPWCTPLVREGIEAALARMQAQYQTQRADALQAELDSLRANPQHNGRVTAKARK